MLWLCCWQGAVLWMCQAGRARITFLWALSGCQVCREPSWRSAPHTAGAAEPETPETPPCKHLKCAVLIPFHCCSHLLFPFPLQVFYKCIIIFPNGPSPGFKQKLLFFFFALVSFKGIAQAGCNSCHIMYCKYRALHSDQKLGLIMTLFVKGRRQWYQLAELVKEIILINLLLPCSLFSQGLEEIASG